MGGIQSGVLASALRVRQHDRVRPSETTRSAAGRNPIAAVAVVAFVALVAGACDPPADEDAARRTSCAATVAEASQESEPSMQVRILDRALLTCGSYATFTSELDRYPGIIGYDTATFVERRCQNVDDEAIRTGPTCSTVIAPVTTPPPTTIVELVFVGDTVDGRQVEIRPSASIEFVGEVPAVVQQTVDIAFESGCEGVLAQRDLWASQIDDSPAGDIASVYAQHAQNVADYIRCDSQPIAVG